MTEQVIPASQGDRVAGVLLLVVQALGVLVCGFLGIMLVFVSDSCDTTNCNTSLISTGMAITALVPAGLWVVSLVHLIVRARRHESTWWVPLLWIVLSGVAAGAGILVAFQGGPNTFH